MCDSCHVYSSYSKLLASQESITVDEKSFFTCLGVSQDLRYAKTYFGEACLEKAKLCFKKTQTREAWQYIVDFLQFGLIKERKEEILSAVNPKDIATSIITYFQKSRHMSRPNHYSPELPDSTNTKKAINLLWQLTYKKKYSQSLDTNTRKTLKSLLLECLLLKNMTPERQML